MKVRIVKAFTDCWYKDQIGSIFNVREGLGLDDKHCYYFDTNHESNYIRFEDCEILPEENQPEPFDLERALKGEPIQTKSGKIVKSLGAGRSKDYNGIVVEIDSEIRIYGRSGAWDTFNDKEALMMAPRESEYVTKWVGVYNDMSRVDSRLFENREDVTYAIPCAIPVPITFKRPK